MRIAKKPDHILSVHGLDFFFMRGEWWNLYLNGYGYNAMLCDGRTVRAFARKQGQLEQYNKCKQHEVKP